MPIKLYMDVHVRRQITAGLLLRGVDVLTAQKDGTTTLPDDELLSRATSLGRVLFSQDTDLLAEASKRMEAGDSFGGVIFSQQTAMNIGECIGWLDLLAKIYDPADIADRIEFIPLR